MVALKQILSANNQRVFFMRFHKLDAFNDLFSAVNDLLNYSFHPISYLPLIVAQYTFLQCHFCSRGMVTSCEMNHDLCSLSRNGDCVSDKVSCWVRLSSLVLGSFLLLLNSGHYPSLSCDCLNYWQIRYFQTSDFQLQVKPP